MELLTSKLLPVFSLNLLNIDAASDRFLQFKEKNHRCSPTSSGWPVTLTTGRRFFSRTTSASSLRQSILRIFFECPRRKTTGLTSDEPPLTDAAASGKRFGRQQGRSALSRIRVQALTYCASRPSHKTRDFTVDSAAGRGGHQPAWSIGGIVATLAACCILVGDYPINGLVQFFLFSI